MPESSIHTGDKVELARLIETAAGPGDWVLVKGSRSMRMEEIIESLGTKNETAKKE